MSDSNLMALFERTSLFVYDADIFNCSRQAHSLLRGGGAVPDLYLPPRSSRTALRFPFDKIAHAVFFLPLCGQELPPPSAAP